MTVKHVLLFYDMYVYIYIYIYAYIYIYIERERDIEREVHMICTCIMNTYMHYMLYRCTY